MASKTSEKRAYSCFCGERPTEGAQKKAVRGGNECARSWSGKEGNHLHIMIMNEIQLHWPLGL